MLIRLARGATLLVALTMLVAGPAVAADTASLDVQGVDGRTVQLLLTFAPRQEVTADTPISATLEVDGRQVAADARVVVDDKRPTTAVLVLDSSGSMKGDRLTAAEAAANKFLDALPPKVDAGLIGFHDTIDVLSEPTTDRAIVRDQIAGLKADGDTALYDAVKAGLARIPADGKGRVLVLSDGKDTSSKESVKQLLKDVKASGVPVDVVALSPTTTELETLRSISAINGGNLRTASSSADLMAAFSAASRDYGARAFITGDVPAGVDARGKPISAQVRVGNQAIDASTTLPQAASLSASAPGPALSSLQASPQVQPVVLEPVKPSLLWPLALGIIAALFVIVIAVAVFGWRERVRARNRLNQVLNYRVSVGSQAPAPVEPGLVKAAVHGLDDLLARGRGYKATTIRIAAADLTMTPATWLLIRLGVSVVLFFAAVLLTASIPVSLIFAAVLGWLVTRMWLGSRVAKRQKAFANELPDFLLLLASGLRAGLSFTSALDSAAEEGKGEVARQMRRALGEVQLGATLDDALSDCADRMDSEDLRWTVTALSIQREVGGNLSTILEAAAETIKQRFALRREVATLSAEGRLSAYILIALPIGIFLFLLLFRRDYISALWQSSLGLAMLGMLIVLIGVGWIWMRSIVRIKV